MNGPYANPFKYTPMQRVSLKITGGVFLMIILDLILVLIQEGLDKVVESFKIRTEV